MNLFRYSLFIIVIIEMLSFTLEIIKILRELELMKYFRRINDENFILNK